MINPSRRGFIFGLGATIAVVRPEILMPIKKIILPDEPVPLPPGEYTFMLDDVTMKQEQVRFLWKVISHGKHYPMEDKRLVEIF